MLLILLFPGQKEQKIMMGFEYLRHGFLRVKNLKMKTAIKTKRLMRLVKDPVNVTRRGY